MYNCLLLSLTIFNKEINHVSVSAHIKWRSRICYMIITKIQTAHIYRSNAINGTSTENIVRVEFYVAVFMWVNVYDSYSAHKNKCTSQPRSSLLKKNKHIGDYCAAAQKQNESPDIHRCVSTDRWLWSSCCSPVQTSPEVNGGTNERK